MLAIVTSCYTGLRSDRPAFYYLTSVNDFLENVKDSKEIIVYVFTNKENNDQLVKSDNIIIRNDELDVLIRDMWDNPNWLADFIKLGPKMPVQQKHPELISIYLSKFSMMRIVGKETGLPVLWYDSGHLRSQRYQSVGLKHPECNYFRQIKYYKKPKINIKQFIDTTKEWLEQSPITWTSFGGFPHQNGEMFIHGVPAKNYMNEFGASSKNNQHVLACFMLARNENINEMCDGVKSMWNRLVSDGKAGLEENAMSMYYWKSNNINIFSYNEWYYGMGFKSKKKELVVVPKTQFISERPQTLNEFFDKVVLINLDTRKDRLESAVKECEKIGLKFERFVATPAKDGHGYKALNNDLIAIFEKAIRDKTSRILMLEDDVFFDENVNEIFRREIRNVPKDWWLLYFGGFFKIDQIKGDVLSRKVKGMIDRPFHIFQTHCVGIEKDVFSKLVHVLHKYSNDSFPSDQIIDAEISPYKRTYTFYPQIAFQKEELGSNLDQGNSVYETRIRNSLSISGRGGFLFDTRRLKQC